MADALHFTGDADADALLARDPLALLIGFVLDQQITVQKAFRGPLDLQARLGRLDAAELARLDSDRLVEIFRERPALHRFPGSMAKRVQELAAVIADEYGGDAARVWSEAADSDDLRRRLAALPGFGEMKVRTLASVLSRRLGVALAEPLAPAHRTLGDVDSPEALAEYQAAKRAAKAAKRAAATA